MGPPSAHSGVLVDLKTGEERANWRGRWRRDRTLPGACPNITLSSSGLQPKEAERDPALPEQMGQPGHEGDEMAVIIITSQIPPVQSPFPKLVQIHYLTDAHNASGHCRPGAVRPIWQDEAPEFREGKRFAQGHTAHPLSEETKKKRIGPSMDLQFDSLSRNLGGAWDEDRY